jgi:hypothetical protein
MQGVSHPREVVVSVLTDSRVNIFGDSTVLALRVTLRLLEDNPNTHKNIKDKFGFE